MRNIVQLVILMAAFSLAVFTGCKKEFDEPPVGSLPNLTANKTLAALIALHTPGGAAVQITDDVIISGIVNADDRSGNFYKQIVIQDSTAGLAIRLNGSGLYNKYPIGTQVFVKCKGLYISRYGGAPQLGGTAASDPIEELRMPSIVIAGAKNQTLKPLDRTITSLTKADINMLIKLDKVEFKTGSAGTTYADAVNLLTVNKILADCNNNEVAVRNSGYADFAAARIPTRNGSLTAVFSVFSTSNAITTSNYQLFIRDTNDVKMTNLRCNGSGGGPGPLATISAIRAVYTGTLTAAPNNKIEGIVTSDRANGNYDTKSVAIQDATAGITVRFTANHTYNVGDKLSIDVTGVELSEFSGLLQLNNCPTANVTLMSSGNTVTPRTCTLADLNANANVWESTLVKIVSATLPSGTYSGNKTLTDPTGTVALYTKPTAAFAGTSMPSGAVSVVGIISDFSGAQLLLRNTTDVSGGVGPTPSVLVNISDIKALYTGAATTIASKKIKGVIISDRSTLNLVANNLVLQDAAGRGVVVRFLNGTTAVNHTFDLGRSLEVELDGAVITKFNGLYQVEVQGLAKATDLGAGTLPTPTVLTTQQATAGIATYESTLVKIVNATINSGTYSGSKTVTDAAGTLTMFTRTQATFAASTVPSTSVSITGYLSIFTTTGTGGIQLQIRGTSDVQ